MYVRIGSKRVTGAVGDETNMGHPAFDKQYQQSVIGYHAAKTLLLLNIQTKAHITYDMKHLMLILLLLAASPASAGCYADYKAKKDNPLRLHYGVIQIPGGACSGSASRAQIVNYVAQRFSGLQWQLLNVISVFDDSGLAQRKASAGQFFLRY